MRLSGFVFEGRNVWKNDSKVSGIRVGVQRDDQLVQWTLGIVSNITWCRVNSGVKCVCVV